MAVRFEQPVFEVNEAARTIRAKFRLVNVSQRHWKRSDGAAVGWQIFDPDSAMFISEGKWNSLPRDIAPAETADIELDLQLPPEKGAYRIYVSLRIEPDGWLYVSGAPFLLVEASVERGKASFGGAGVATLKGLQRQALRNAAGKAFTMPLGGIIRHRALIRSMVKRDILSRYRGSFADVFWTVLNPLLLTLTYFFVFGVVLQSRLGGDQSRTGFALYFLAGMLPWFAFSEALARAPYLILEHRNFVKKLVFPVEILPVNASIGGLITEAFALLVFLIALIWIRGGIPLTAAWLPAVLIPQMMFTMGLAWALAAVSVYVRDLAHVIGFVLTLWFFLTPICYPEAALPDAAAAILTKNPVYALVRAYRMLLLEGQVPSWSMLLKLWLVGGAAFVAGHAIFHKLRKSFADVI